MDEVADCHHIEDQIRVELETAASLDNVQKRRLPAAGRRNPPRRIVLLHFIRPAARNASSITLPTPLALA